MELRKQTSGLFLRGDFVEEKFVNVQGDFFVSLEKDLWAKKKVQNRKFSKRWNDLLHMLQDSRFFYLHLPSQREKSNLTESCLWTSSALDTRQNAKPVNSLALSCDIHKYAVNSRAFLNNWKPIDFPFTENFSFFCSLFF